MMQIRVRIHFITNYNIQVFKRDGSGAFRTIKTAINWLDYLLPDGSLDKSIYNALEIVIKSNWRVWQWLKEQP
jgi:hypothetical protein